MSKPIQTVAIIGLGALGVLYGHHLSKKIPQSHLRIIADQGRIRRYRQKGLTCNGEDCQFQYMTPEEKADPVDLILFTVKNTGLQQAIEAVRNQVGEHTLILSLLNGVTSEEMISHVYGSEKVLYCVAQGMDAVKQDNHLTYQHMGFLFIGDKEPGPPSSGTEAVADFFGKTAVPYEIDAQMYRRLWSKLMLNVGVNQAVSVYGQCYGDVQQEGQAREVMIQAMREVIPLSAKESIPLSEEDITYWLGVISRLSPHGKPSMRQDIEAKRPSEAELFAGTVIRLGEKHQIPTPVNRMLYEKIKQLENSYEVPS